MLMRSRSVFRFQCSKQSLMQNSWVEGQECWSASVTVLICFSTVLYPFSLSISLWQVLNQREARGQRAKSGTADSFLQRPSLAHLQWHSGQHWGWCQPCSSLEPASPSPSLWGTDSWGPQVYAMSLIVSQRKAQPAFCIATRKCEGLENV